MSEPMQPMNAIAVEAINRPLYDLSNHPDHAKLIGQIVVVFSAIELQFLSLFAHLMRAPPWRSQTAYGEVINRNTHMDMIRGLTKDMPMKGDFDARILDAVEESRTIADLRNKYVHGFWIEKNGQPYLLTDENLTLGESQKKPVSIDELHAHLAQIRAFEEKIAALTQEFSENYPLIVMTDETRAAWREKHRRRP